jgi:hypothetical protein
LIQRLTLTPTQISYNLSDAPVWIARSKDAEPFVGSVRHVIFCGAGCDMADGYPILIQVRRHDTDNLIHVSVSEIFDTAPDALAAIQARASQAAQIAQANLIVESTP